MEIFNRATLRGFFKKGKVPTEVHFSNLIDSTINKIDDGFSKTNENGLKLASGEGSKKLISLYDDIKKKDPQWDISLNPTEAEKGLAISEDGRKSALFLQSGGNVGVGTTNPSYQLDIDGTVGMKSRVGTFQSNTEVPADGEWRIIIDDLDGCYAFEIVAKVEGEKGRGKYAMAHAIAISAFNNTRVKVTQAHYGWFWHRLKFRWRRNRDEKFRLEIKTGDDYGFDKDNNGIKIKYHITSLWGDQMSNDVTEVFDEDNHNNQN